MKILIAGQPTSSSSLMLKRLTRAGCELHYTKRSVKPTADAQALMTEAQSSGYDWLIHGSAALSLRKANLTYVPLHVAFSGVAV